MKYLRVNLNRNTETILVGGMTAYHVTEDGNGDDAIFDQYPIFAELPQDRSPQFEIHYRYPMQLRAGDHFNLSVDILNTGTFPLWEVYPQIFGFDYVENFGLENSHATSYLPIECQDFCIAAGEFPLQPGASITIDLSNYYYQNPKFFDGFLQLPEIDVSAYNMYLEETIISPLESLDPIKIDAPYWYNSSNPQNFLSSRMPLELKEAKDESGLDIIFDPNTGIEWLPMYETSNIPLVEMLQKFDNGELFDGFEVASANQVDTLVLNHLHAKGVPAADFQLGQASREIESSLLDFIALFGENSRNFGNILEFDPSPFLGGFVRGGGGISSGEELAKFYQISAANPGTFSFFPAANSLILASIHLEKDRQEYG